MATFPELPEPEQPDGTGDIGSPDTDTGESPAPKRGRPVLSADERKRRESERRAAAKRDARARERERRAAAAAGSGAATGGTEPVSAAAQLAGLTDAFGGTFKMAFNFPAAMRSMQWGIIGTAPNGEPIPAGAHWMLTDEEAHELAKAWARVAQLYAPPELTERGGAIMAAVSTTAMVVSQRIMADAQIAAMVRNQQHITAEFDVSPNGSAAASGPGTQQGPPGYSVPGNYGTQQYN